jgi:hypothetical protein
MRKGVMAIAAAVALGAATMATGVTAAPHGGGGGGGGHMGGGGAAFGGGGRMGGGGAAFGGGAGGAFAGRPGFAFNRGFRGRRFGPGFGWWGGPLWAYTGTCWRLRHVWTPWGWRWRRIWVC